MKTVFISILVFLVGAVVLVNIPIHYLSLEKMSLGAFTDISSATQISNFPSIYNANLDLTLETSDYYGTTTHAKISSLPSLTTAGSLATIGTITSGTWNGNTIGIGYGGTNITTYSTGDLLYASATNVLSKLVASSSGEVLTLSGGVPVWRDASINPAGNFTFTGEWTFDGGGSATTTFNRGVDIDADSDTPLILRAISYIFPSSGGSADQILTTNGSTPQTLSWVNETVRDIDTNWNLDAEISGTNVASTSLMYVRIPANTLDSETHIEFEINADHFTGGATCLGSIELGNGSATTTIYDPYVGKEHYSGIIVATSTNSVFMRAQNQVSSTLGATFGSNTTNGYTEDQLSTASQIHLGYVMRLSGGPDDCQIYGYSVKAIGK